MKRKAPKDATNRVSAAPVKLPFFPPETPPAQRLKTTALITNSIRESEVKSYDNAAPRVEEVIRTIRSSDCDPKEAASKALTMARQNHTPVWLITRRLDDDLLKRMEDFRVKFGELPPDLVTQRREIEQRQEIGEAEINMGLAMHHLCEAAWQGNADAVIALAKHMQLGCTLLAIACNLNPDTVKRYAEVKDAWPVIVDRNGRCSDADKTMLMAIGVGSQAPIKAGAKQSSAASRAWAREILEHLEKHRQVYKPQCLEDNAPEWLRDCATLPRFDRVSFTKWWAVAKKMLQAECPNLAEVYPRSGEIRKSLLRRDQPTPGRISAKIMEEIRSSLFQIAAE